MVSWPSANTHFTPGTKNPPTGVEREYFVFKGADILLAFDAAGRWLPQDSLEGLVVLHEHYLGQHGNKACFAVEVSDAPFKFAGLRSLFGKVDNFVFSLAGRAWQVLDWHNTHQFCGRCGSSTRNHAADRAMVCDTCHIQVYPRLSPSIITLVHSGDQVLLARNHSFPSGMFSTLAGFVEPGESIEDTLRREVREEVGVEVSKLEYMGSQPWPFPNSLMLGFLAEYQSGEISLQVEEIAEAHWFDCRKLPDLPGPVAISRWLIDAYLQRLGLLEG